MQILADPITVNCRKVIAGLKMMGIDYSLEKVDYFKAEQKSPEYVSVNPNACLPAMRDGDLVLWESNAILQYAADKHGKTDAYPTEPSARADHNRWMFWEAANWFPSCYVYLVENCVKPLLQQQTDPAVLAGEDERFHKLAGILDDRLKDRAFIMDDVPTLADVAVAAPMHLHEWMQLPLDSHPHLRAWMSRIESQPFWKATHVDKGFVLAQV